MYDLYQIINGDTINTIASKYGTSPEVLKSLNPNSTFAVGTYIVVPTLKEYFNIYTIKKGDTLYSIAKEYNTDYNLLAMLNGMKVEDYIYPNTTILVPKKDIKYYFTKDNDTLLSVNNALKSNLNNLLKQNKNIFLREGQLIVYKDY